MKSQAEKNADNAAADGYSRHLKAGRRRKLGNLKHIEIFRLDFQDSGEFRCDQRRDHTGKKGGVVHNSHADYFHGKYSRGHRRSEYGGKCGAHSAHDHNVLILLVQTEPPSDLISDAPSKLDSRAFPSGGSSCKVGQNSGDKDQGRGA